VSYNGGNTIHSETDGHPYGTGIKKYRVTMQQELNNVLTIQQFPQEIYLIYTFNLFF
jgi:hypothetical protein